MSETIKLFAIIILVALFFYCINDLPSLKWLGATSTVLIMLKV